MILKPDTPLVPTHCAFVAEASAVESFDSIGDTGAPPVLPPLVAHTSSNFEANKIEYVFAYNRGSSRSSTVSFAPQELRFSGEVYVYDYFNRTESASRRRTASRLRLTARVRI
jgi:hypothetical protein